MKNQNKSNFMSQEKLHELYNYLFLGTGTASAGVALNLDLANNWGALIVKGISVASFLCFLLINQDKISQGWTKFKNRFKKKK